MTLQPSYKKWWIALEIILKCSPKMFADFARKMLIIFMNKKSEKFFYCFTGFCYSSSNLSIIFLWIPLLFYSQLFCFILMQIYLLFYCKFHFNVMGQFFYNFTKNSTFITNSPNIFNEVTKFCQRRHHFEEREGVFALRISNLVKLF